MRRIEYIKKVLVNVLLLIVVCIICLIFIEIIVNILSPNIFHPNLMLRPNAKMKVYSNLSGIKPVTNHTTNKWGFRGDKIPVTLEDYHFILTIGSSSTRCYYLDDKDTWPYLLQKHLQSSQEDKVIVQNAGLGGHSTRANLLMMKYVVPKIKPDTIIILVGKADLGLSIDREKFYGYNQFETTTLHYNLFTKVRLLQILWSWKQVLLGEVKTINAAHHNLILKNLTKPESIFSLNYQEELISLPEFEKNIKEIIKIGKENNIRMIFLTQPLLFEDNEYWSNIEPDNSWLEKQELFYVSAGTYAEMLDIFNNKLLEICEKEQVECFDLANKIPHSLDYYYDMCHFNEKGARLVAREIYENIDWI